MREGSQLFPEHRVNQAQCFFVCSIHYTMQPDRIKDTFGAVGDFANDIVKINVVVLRLVVQHFILHLFGEHAGVRFVACGFGVADIHRIAGKKHFE